MAVICSFGASYVCVLFFSRERAELLAKETPKERMKREAKERKDAREKKKQRARDKAEGKKKNKVRVFFSCALACMWACARFFACSQQRRWHSLTIPSPDLAFKFYRLWPHRTPHQENKKNKATQKVFADMDLLAMYSDYAHQEQRRRAAVRAAEEDRLLQYSQTVCKQTARVGAHAFAIVHWCAFPPFCMCVLTDHIKHIFTKFAGLPCSLFVCISISLYLSSISISLGLCLIHMPAAVRDSKDSPYSRKYNGTTSATEAEAREWRRK